MPMVHTGRMGFGDLLVSHVHVGQWGGGSGCSPERSLTPLLSKLGTCSKRGFSVSIFDTPYFFHVIFGLLGPSVATGGAGAGGATVLVTAAVTGGGTGVGVAGRGPTGGAFTPPFLTYPSAIGAGAGATVTGVTGGRGAGADRLTVVDGAVSPKVVTYAALRAGSHTSTHSAGSGMSVPPCKYATTSPLTVGTPSSVSTKYSQNRALRELSRVTTTTR